MLNALGRSERCETPLRVHQCTEHGCYAYRRVQAIHQDTERSLAAIPIQREPGAADMIEAAQLAVERVFCGTGTRRARQIRYLAHRSPATLPPHEPAPRS